MTDFDLGNAAHLCVDMQRIFAEDVGWQAPTLMEVVPNIGRIVRARPGHTIFARFIVPPSADAMGGAWQSYYRRWDGIVEAVRRDPGLSDLVAPLWALQDGEMVFDKATYSMFTDGRLDPLLAARKVSTVVVTGAETDVCVLATVMDAMERGLFVVLVRDAVTSSSLAGHDATLDHVLTRVPDQVAIITTDALLIAYAG